MANAMKTRMNELMSQEIEKNPEISQGKKWIGYAIIAWLLSRLVFHAVDLICVAQDFWEFSPSNLISLVVSVLFMVSAYAGVKLFAILPIIGGFLMLGQSVTSGYFDILLSSEYYTIVRLYVAAFVLTALVQMAAFLFVIVNKKSRAYFDAFARVNSAVTQEGKSL